MKTNPIRFAPLRSLVRSFLFLTALLTAGLRAGDATPSASSESDRIIAAVRAVDDERVAATKAGDRARLEAIYVDALRYGHGNGRIDTKAILLEALATRSTVYEIYNYLERNFTPVAPGVVLMSGRAFIRVRKADGPSDADLIFLGVWREEGGRWRFFAWQSCKSAPPAAAK